MDLRDEVEFMLDVATSGNMTEMVSYMIFGSVVTTTKAFESVKVNIDPKTNRVFIPIKLRWWARFKRMEPLRVRWIKQAEANAIKYVPEGWKTLIYYVKE